MGWASGSSLLSEVWGEVREYVPVRKRTEVLIRLMEMFSNYDCDTLCEVVYKAWPETQKAFDTLYPPEEEDEE